MNDHIPDPTKMISDGGPAFATTATATSIARRDDGSSILTNYGSSAGMSLRDYFAAAALQGLLGNSGFHVETDVESEIPNAIAKYSYEAADAMLKAREAK